MDKVALCNLALSALGDDTISTLTDASTLAELCSTNFDAVRDAVLGERAWRFATVRRQLAADATAPAWGAAHRYALPKTVIQVLEASDGTHPLPDWRREGGFVLTDQAGPIYIRSVEQIEDVSLWPPGFCQAVAARLAAVLAVPVTESRPLAEQLWKLYRMRLSEAGTADALQGVHGSTRTNTVNRWRL